MCELIKNLCQTSTSISDFIDYAYKIGMFAIGITNIIFVIIIKNSKDNKQKEQDRKLLLMKTLILDKNLTYLYEFFSKLDIKLKELKKSNITEEEKRNISVQTEDYFIEVREKFLDLFIPINDNLNNKLVHIIDELQEHLSKRIIDEGIKLSHAPKFNEEIAQKLSESKRNIIKEIFDYKGV